MRIVIQRVRSAHVAVAGEIKGEIGQGLLLFVGIEHADQEEDAVWLSEKIRSLRIFSDQDGKMNLSVADVTGDILVISQFTLHASTKKGNRPSFIDAARPEQAIPLYQFFIRQLESLTGKPVATGIFGADMQVSLINDGPVTIIMDSKLKN
jgi:D-tyrosyl-tRNA(Tyr) deacylase